MDNIEISRAKSIINSSKYFTIGTCSENSPWVTPLYFAHDDEYNFYWISSVESRHSTNILNNSKVTAVIFNSTDEESNINGVYLEGIVSIVEDNDIKSALDLFEKKRDALKSIYTHHSRKDSDYFGNSPKKVYKLTVENSWLLGGMRRVGNHMIDFRVDINLKN